jgi:hypothetical protein
MRRGHPSNGVPDQYLEDNLPLGFYTNPPPDTEAIFSTMKGKREFRTVEHILPARNIHLWTGLEVQSACNSLRQIFWDCMKSMKQPHCWDDLWQYFDAHDLYHYGALNLWNVINHLFDENQLIFLDVSRQQAMLVGQWADRWLMSDENKARLMKWDETKGPISSSLSDADTESLGPIQDDAITLIASALKTRRDMMVSETRTEKSLIKPTPLVTACQEGDIQNWLGKHSARSTRIRIWEIDSHTLQLGKRFFLTVAFHQFLFRRNIVSRLALNRVYSFPMQGSTILYLWIRHQTPIYLRALFRIKQCLLCANQPRLLLLLLPRNNNSRCSNNRSPQQLHLRLRTKPCQP